MAERSRILRSMAGDLVSRGCEYEELQRQESYAESGAYSRADNWEEPKAAYERTQWNEIRKGVFQMSGGKCVVCGSSDRLSCHEAWKFNEAKGIQKLFRLESRCGICHFVEHLGMAESLARQGELDFNAVIQHFCKVNRCDVGHFLSHRERAAARWIKRSRKTWKINFGKYDALLPTTAKGPHKPFDPAEAFIVKNAGPKQERAQKSKRGKL